MLLFALDTRTDACEIGHTNLGSLLPPCSSAAAKKELKSKLKSDPSKVDATKSSTRFFDGADDGDSDEDEDAAANTFNFNQYFPNTLPLSLHHPEDDAADPDSDALLMRQGVPEDLALRQVMRLCRWMDAYMYTHFLPCFLDC